MSLVRPAARKHREPTVALMDMVFLLLKFYLIAGTLAMPLDPALELVRTRDLEGVEPPDALVLTETGALTFRGAPAEVAGWLAGRSAADLARVRIVPDRDAPAARLVEVAAELRAAGAGAVVIVTRKQAE